MKKDLKFLLQLNNDQISNLVKQKFEIGKFNGYTKKQIVSFFKVSPIEDEDKNLYDNFCKVVYDTLNSLIQEKQLVVFDGKYYYLGVDYFIGTFRGTLKEYGFVSISQKKEDDLFIFQRNQKDCINGDLVLVRKNIYNGKPEGIVEYIIDRPKSKIVGTIVYYYDRLYLDVDGNNFPFLLSFDVKDKNIGKVYEGDKVVAEIDPLSVNNPYVPCCYIIEKLGASLDFDTEEKSLMIALGINNEFSQEVLNEANNLPNKVEEIDVLGRLDLRDKLIITIDGDDSRDFDDAISVEKIDDNYIIGVHIADVSHYVKKNSAIDKEAFLRGTSIYFPRNVVPMLPEKLSNGICSLNEGVDRLTISCFATIDKNGNIMSTDIQKSVIKSKNRMTYNNIQKMLDGDKETLTCYSHLVALVENCREVEEILEKVRKEKGEIELSVKECEISFKENKIDINPREQSLSRKIIEEFMILANEIVAEFLFNFDIPSIYRVHEKPEKDKIGNFIKIINMFGYKTKWNEETCHPSDLQKVLEYFKDKKTFGIVNKLLLRSLPKAYYSTSNLGHFGLGSSCYTHFTSPIRRYPDLIVHRVLTKCLEGNVDDINAYSNFIEDAAKNSSLMELKADSSERSVDDFYKVYYMKDKVGYVYQGIVSGANKNGIFVEFDKFIEGYASVDNFKLRSKNTLIDISYDESTFTLKYGTRTYSIGDNVYVLVADASISQRRIDLFVISEKEYKKSLTYNK